MSAKPIFLYQIDIHQWLDPNTNYAVRIYSVCIDLK